MRHIVALSGGESSAAVAVLLREVPGLILYFNDTGWEDADLHRYLGDLSKYLGIPITEDSDGRNIEQMANDEDFLPNNRVPVCSRIMKADRLQKFAKQGDVVYFGIGIHEIHRAARIRSIYQPKGIFTEFPLIDKKLDANGSHEIMDKTGIPRPRMYDEGFKHNNCAGGCVRQGSAAWRHLLRVRPEVYADRERFEREFSEKRGFSHTFMKDISLKRLREIEETQGDLFEDDEYAGECIGMCGSMV